MIGDKKKDSAWKSKRLFAALVCTLLLVVLAVGIFLWAPWEAGQDGSDATQDSTSEIQDVTDETNDSDTQAEDEEWPGQSLGYVGPNGEGALKDYDYETAEEYTALIEDVFNGGWENYVERETVSDSDGEYVKGFLLVWFECSEYDAHEIAEKHGAVWVQDSYMYMEEANERVLVTLYFSNAQDREDLEEIAETLCIEDGVGGAELIDVVGVLASDSEVVTAASNPLLQYYLINSNFYDAWEIQKCEGEATIAILDAGFDLNHPDLGTNILLGYDATTCSYLNETTTEGDGHGTMVAGVASAVAGNVRGIDGASYNASLFVVRVMDNQGKIYWDYVINALNWLSGFSDNLLPDVVNMSFSFTGVDSDTEETVVDLIEELQEDGTVFVAASGNWDAETESSSYFIKYPASFDGVISVGSVNISNEIASTSNRNEYVDLCAPGVEIYTTFNTEVITTLKIPYGTVSGTSFAAPQVAAAAALIKAKYPDATADEIEQALELSARDLGTSGRDDEYGWGALDAAAALELMDEWRDSGDTSPNTGGSIYDAWDSLLGRVGLFALPEERLVGIAA